MACELIKFDNSALADLTIEELDEDEVITVFHQELPLDAPIAYGGFSYRYGFLNDGEPLFIKFRMERERSALFKQGALVPVIYSVKRLR